MKVKFKATCPFGCTCSGIFTLEDVDTNLQIKRYSDSQHMSFTSNLRQSAMLGSDYKASAFGDKVREQRNKDKENFDQSNNQFGRSESKLHSRNFGASH